MVHRQRYAIALVAGFLATLGMALAQSAPAPTPSEPQALLAKFWEAYTSGDGLTYVVIKDGKGERIYRYGDASRLAAKKDPRGFLMFTCASPHVFIVEQTEDQADLLNARVVKAGEADFAQLDAKYLAGCHNPFVKSAIPKATK